MSGLMGKKRCYLGRGQDAPELSALTLFHTRGIQYCFTFLVLDPHLKSNRLPPGSSFVFFHPFLPTPPNTLLPKTCRSDMHDDVYYKPENLAQRWVIIWPFSQSKSTTTPKNCKKI